jgi:hypothetical protein
MDVKKQIDSLLATATHDAWVRQCQDAARGLSADYQVFIRPAYGPLQPAAPFIGTEPLNGKWKRARGLVFSAWKSERENATALRDAFYALPLYATQFGPEHADLLDL